MIKIFLDYFTYMFNNVYNKSRWLVFIYYFILPSIVVWVIFLVFKLASVHGFFINTNQELINIFSLTSGFLFMSVSLIVWWNLSLSDEKIEYLKNKLDFSDKKDVLRLISSLKRSLFYDIIFQFILSLVCIIFIAFLKSIWVWVLWIIWLYIIIFLSTIVFISILRLLKNLMIFISNTIFED